MASYNIFFKRSAEKELRSIPKPFLSKILEKVKSLAQHPRPHGAQMLKGEKRYFRMRQGDYRIIYEVNDDAKTITIIKIGHRKEVYANAT